MRDLTKTYPSLIYHYLEVYIYINVYASPLVNTILCFFISGDFIVRGRTNVTLGGEGI